MRAGVGRHSMSRHEEILRQKEVLVDEVPEVEFAARLGLSRELVAEARKKLLEGDHWVKRGSMIVITAAGVERLGELLGVKKMGQASPEAAEEAVILTKVSRFYLNPRVIGCVDGSGNTLIVRVKNTANFRIGMECPLKKCGASGGFALAKRHPRWPGRW